MEIKFNISIDCYNNHSDFVNFEANIILSEIDQNIKIDFPIDKKIIFIGIQPDIVERKAILSNLFLLFSESANQILRKYNYGGIVSFTAIKYSYMDSRPFLYKNKFIQFLEEKLKAINKEG